MKLTRGREHVINLGQYESLRLSASIEVEFDERFETMVDKYTDLDAMLDNAMRNDLKEAEKLTDVRNSYVITWNAEREN